MTHKLLESLTAPQREAVLHCDGPLLILAGPGSGKTRVITHRIAWMLHQGVAAREILALTFTNKAADEMKARVATLAPDRPVWVSTFHRFCARLLRDHAPLVGLEPNFTIYDTSDVQAALKRAIQRIDFDPQHYTLPRIAGAISSAKNGMVRASQYESLGDGALARVVGRIYPAYQDELIRSNAVDFDDLLLHVANMLRENPELRSTLDARYRYVMVDEYQDTNLAQYTIVRALSIEHPNLAVTGDPDQSIYGWRGASLNNILEFEHDYPDVTVVRLEQNYRSTKRILHVAADLIRHNRHRKEKDLFTENEEGQPVNLTCYSTQRDEADAIAGRISQLIAAGTFRPRDIAIFYRVNALSRTLEFSLREQGIPYQIVRGVEFFQRKEIKDVLSYLILVNNPRDNTALMRVINTPKRQIGPGAIEKLAAHATRYGMPLLEAARESGLIEALPKKTAVNIAKFVALYDRICLQAAGPVAELVETVLNESGYREMLAGSDDEEDQERLANVEELVTAAREFDNDHPEAGHLETFLEQVSLVNDTDAWDEEQDRVTMMTLHASKGLEFPVVFIVAVEEGLIPHERSRNDPLELEEERRLLFVGITRAEKQLFLSRAVYRDFRGQGRMTVPSAFLLELPLAEMDVVDRGLGAMAESHAAIDWSTFEGHEADLSELPYTAPVRNEPAVRTLPGVTTAAQLAAAAGDTSLAAAPVSATPSARPAPDSFVAGMAVKHPEYGLGKIVSVSGQGSQRVATVAFAADARQRKFVLERSTLLPLR
ncbi:MAG: UvrD-helicase domain-containing protein [Planctomycetes bacterium]|nr:UvrD-helicase domain-containing protein [Planctomycetota bacterium]